jgi:hypothetical protein
MATTAKGSTATPSKKTVGKTTVPAATAAKAAPKTITKSVTKTAPASRAAVQQPPAKAKAPTASTTTPSRLSPAPRPRPGRVTTEQRRNYIEVAAYYIAERRGFMGGHQEEDWTNAEIEIDRMLSEGKLNT